MEKTPKIISRAATPPRYDFPSTPVNLSTGETHLKLRGSRLFTPIKNFINSPDVSPIENLKNQTVFRLPPEKVDKAPADSSTLDFSISPANVINKSYLNHKIDLETFLVSINFQKYLKIFEEFTFDEFVSLSEIDFLRLGVNSAQDRSKMLRAINEFKG